MRLAVKGVCFSYRSVDALRDVSIEVGSGEVVSLVGPNGSGKSTLLKCINRILKPKRGAILVEGKDVEELTLRELSRVAGYVPQSAGYAFPATVFDSVLLGRRPYVGWSVGSKDKEIVSRTLALLGLKDLVMREFSELSGGERQKVLIARAMAQEPDVLLLDEPTSNLDMRHQLEVLGIITAAARTKNISALMAIHDLNLASRFSDKIVFLKEGAVYAVGEPKQVITVENIAAVYGVEAIINGDLDRPHVVPIGPLRA